MTEHIGKSAFASRMTSDAEDLETARDHLSWEKRLQAARAHRARVIAQRKASENSLLMGLSRLVLPEHVQRRLAKGAPAGFGWAGLFAKFCLVFVAAFGFGMGAVLGLGILAQQRAEPSVQAAVLTQALPVDPTPDPVSVSNIAPRNPLLDPEKSTLLMPVTASVVLPLAPEKATSPPAMMIPPATVSALSAISVRQDAAPFSQPVDFTGLEAFVAPAPGAAPRWIAGVLRGNALSVYLHVPEGVGQSQVTRLIARLDEAGIDVAKIGREPFRVSSTHLRYYAADTAPAAQAIADTLGVDARDFSSDTNLAGRIELWVEGNPIETETEAVEPRVGFLSRLFGAEG